MKMLDGIIYAVIVLHPGLTIGKVAKKLGVRHSTVEGRLVAMENAKTFRVSEDADGGLYPYMRNGRPSQWLASQV